MKNADTTLTASVVWPPGRRHRALDDCRMMTLADTLRTAAVERGQVLVLPTLQYEKQSIGGMYSNLLIARVRTAEVLR